MAKLDVINASKSFGQTKVIDQMNLDVKDGEMVCLIDASGSGKSTLLRCLNLLESLDDGQILLDGAEISTPGLDPQPIRQRIGIVFQSFHLIPTMTALEN